MTVILGGICFTCCVSFVERATLFLWPTVIAAIGAVAAAETSAWAGDGRDVAAALQSVLPQAAMATRAARRRKQGRHGPSRS